MISQQNFTAEDQLCLLLARGHKQPGVEERAGTLLAAPLCWDTILRRLIGEGILPIFYRSLCRLGFQGVPAEVRSRLETHFKLNAVRNTLLEHELARILKALSDAAVPAIPLKGVALAESLYGDTALRVCTDLDILVPPGSVARSLNVLLANGYEGPIQGKALVQVPLHNGGIEYSLTREQDGFRYLLELHWGLLCGSRIDEKATADLFRDSHPGAVFGAPTHTLTFEWEFSFLVLHAAHHRWNQLKWLVDVHDACSMRPLDWEKVRLIAERYGWTEIFEEALSICNSLFDTVIPQGFSTRSVPANLLVREDPSALDLHSALFHMRSMKGTSDRVRYVLRRLCVPGVGDYLFLRLPSSLGLLYYLIRPFRLSWAWLLVPCFHWVRAKLVSESRPEEVR